MATSGTSSSTPLTGCVKWFDNGLNYGFITVLTEGEHHNADVFVHQSNIQTKRDCFRTLYTGECVQFALAKSDNEKHPFHAVNVNGFNGVMLHCENPNYRPSGNFQSRVNRGNYSRSSDNRNSQTTDANTNADTTANTTTVADNHQQVQTENTTENTTVEQTTTSVVPEAVQVQGNTTRETGVRRGRGRGKLSSVKA